MRCALSAKAEGHRKGHGKGQAASLVADLRRSRPSDRDRWEPASQVINLLIVAPPCHTMHWWFAAHSQFIEMREVVIRLRYANHTLQFHLHGDDITTMSHVVQRIRS